MEEAVDDGGAHNVSIVALERRGTREAYDGGLLIRHGDTRVV